MRSCTVWYGWVRSQNSRVRSGTDGFGWVRLGTVGYGRVRSGTVWYGLIRFVSARYGWIRVRYGTGTLKYACGYSISNDGKVRTFRTTN